MTPPEQLADLAERHGDRLLPVTLDATDPDQGVNAVDMALAYSRRQIEEATAWEAVSRSADYAEPYPADPPLDEGS